jgi:uncharacterized membrane protein YfcA
MANLSRIIVWWREVNWRACAAYSATAVPFAALGAATLLALPARVIEAALGVFFIAMIGALPWEIAFKGLIVGATLMAGAFIAKRFVLKMDPGSFRLLMDGLMLLSGTSLLIAAFI